MYTEIIIPKTERLKDWWIELFLKMVYSGQPESLMVIVSPIYKILADDFDHKQTLLYEAQDIQPLTKHEDGELISFSDVCTNFVFAPNIDSIKDLEPDFVVRYT